MCVCVEELVHLTILHCGCGEFNFTIAQAQTAPNKMSLHVHVHVNTEYIVGCQLYRGVNVL